MLLETKGGIGMEMTDKDVIEFMDTALRGLIRVNLRRGVLVKSRHAPWEWDFIDFDETWRHTDTRALAEYIERATGCAYKGDLDRLLILHYILTPMETESEKARLYRTIVRTGWRGGFIDELAAAYYGKPFSDVDRAERIALGKRLSALGFDSVRRREKGADSRAWYLRKDVDECV